MAAGVVVRALLYNGKKLIEVGADIIRAYTACKLIDSVVGDDLYTVPNKIISALWDPQFTCWLTFLTCSLNEPKRNDKTHIHDFLPYLGMYLCANVKGKDPGPL